MVKLCILNAALLVAFLVGGIVVGFSELVLCTLGVCGTIWAATAYICQTIDEEGRRHD